MNEKNKKICFSFPYFLLIFMFHTFYIIGITLFVGEKKKNLHAEILNQFLWLYGKQVKLCFFFVSLFFCCFCEKRIIKKYVIIYVLNVQ
jgi:hypothetical protein